MPVLSNQSIEMSTFSLFSLFSYLSLFITIFLFSISVLIFSLTSLIIFPNFFLSRSLRLEIFFLCSDNASFITGQNLSVDGGFEATGVGLPALRKNNV